jgi:HK97 family phage major capsid protein
VPPNSDVSFATEFPAQAGELKRRFDRLVEMVEKNPNGFHDSQRKEARESLVHYEEGCRQLWEDREARGRAREKYEKRVVAVSEAAIPISVNEPDLYTEGGRSFFADLYRAQLKHDPNAQERVGRHHAHELERLGDVEQFAITSGTLGGIIPPAYLIELYAKASRNGRVYADQANNGRLPDVGMSIVLPRLTTGLAAGVQATESTALTTQDPVEADLSVPVRTLGGYSPVSRQAIERAAYSDQILFEDLTARYWALLDTQCITGAGTSGTILGVLNTAGVSSSTAGTATVVGVWPKIADVIQQINTSVGGLGIYADKVIMHPRRWGFFEAALDSQNRPIFGISGQQSFNAMAQGDAAGSVANGAPPVGAMHGLPVYIDANIPTNLGAGTNEDRIIVEASRVVHLFERANDPVTLSFEQQAGTSLQVQLIAYGYAAFSAGRYPAASGIVSGAGLVPPTF